MDHKFRAEIIFPEFCVLYKRTVASHPVSVSNGCTYQSYVLIRLSLSYRVERFNEILDNEVGCIKYV